MFIHREMLVKIIEPRLIFYWLCNSLIIISLFSCIKSNTPNLKSLLLPQVTSPIEAYPAIGFKLEGCILSFDKGNEKISTCFNLDRKDCNIDFFLNISSEQILTKRKNDLSFLNINFSNCSNSGLALVSKYNSLSIPSSTMLKDILNINNLSELTNLRFSNTYSCEISNFTQPPLIGNTYVRLLSKEELLSLNSLEMELSLFSNTTVSCMQDLNISNEIMNFLSQIKDKKYLTGIPCSDSSTSTFEKCLK